VVLEVPFVLRQELKYVRVFRVGVLCRPKGSGLLRLHNPHARPYTPTGIHVREMQKFSRLVTEVKNRYTMVLSYRD